MSAPPLLYLTRARALDERTGEDISFDDWLELVDDDDELSFDEAIGPGMALWDGFSSFDAVLFEYRSGRIVSRFDDDFVVEKLLDMSIRLRANLFSHDGRIFPGPDDDPYNRKQRRARGPLERIRSFFNRRR